MQVNLRGTWSPAYMRSADSTRRGTPVDNRHHVTFAEPIPASQLLDVAHSGGAFLRRLAPTNIGTARGLTGGTLNDIARLELAYQAGPHPSRPARG